MKKNYVLLLGVLLVIMLSSCAKSITVNYQVDSENTGTLVLQPSRATKSTSVTINDNLLVNEGYVYKVTINNLPEGEYQVHYVSDNQWYKNKLDKNMKVNIKKNKIITKLIEVPPYSTGYWIYQGCLWSGQVFILALPWLFF